MSSNTNYSKEIEEILENKKIIEDEADRLMDMRYELDDLEHYIKEVGAGEIPVTKYNNTIDRYNQLAEEYNSNIKALKKLVDETMEVI